MVFIEFYSFLRASYKSAFTSETRINHASRGRGIEVMLGPSLHTLKRHAKSNGYDADYTARLVAVAGRLRTLKVPTVFSLMHLAILSNTPWRHLRSIVQRRTDDYQVFTIRKRSGGNRRICAPNPILRRAQSWIHQHILCSLGSLAKVHEASAAYAPLSSIRKNAELHAGAAWMVSHRVAGSSDHRRNPAAYLSGSGWHAALRSRRPARDVPFLVAVETVLADASARGR